MPFAAPSRAASPLSRVIPRANHIVLIRSPFPRRRRSSVAVAARAASPTRDDDHDDHARAISRARERDTIAPMPEWLYPRALDVVPAVLGRLNPASATLAFYTGAVLREARGSPAIAFQWLALVVAPSFALMYFIRRALFARMRGNMNADAKTFARASRGAWVDAHAGYMLLLPAGAMGGEGASFWLLLCPAIIFARWFASRRWVVAKLVARAATVVGGALALATLGASAWTTLAKSIAALRGGGLVGIALGSAAMAMVYVMYVAPASLLPRAIIRAWTNADADADADADVVARKVTSEGASIKTPEEIAAEKKKKRVSFLIGVAAFAATLATGSDAPLFALFALQLFRVEPAELMNAMIDKGSPERAEFEQRLADAFSGAMAKLKNPIGRDAAQKVDENDAAAKKEDVDSTPEA